MKKLMMAMGLATTIFAGTLTVFAGELGTETEVSTNMTSETYLEVRTNQVEEALKAGKITQEQANLLLQHIKEVAAEGNFGHGPSNDVKGDGNVTCVLGEDSNLGIFRSESAGQRLGNGNGVGAKNGNGNKDGERLEDGNGFGRGNKGSGRGNANRGAGLNSDNCVLDIE